MAAGAPLRRATAVRLVHEYLEAEQEDDERADRRISRPAGG